MLDESAYLDTVRTESGVVVAIDNDKDAANDCPIDWYAGHAAALVVDAEDHATAKAIERLGSADISTTMARWYAVDDEDEAEREAFTKHYRRKGWTVETHTVRGDMGEYPITAVLAIDDGYGTTDALAKELEDWAFGHVYTLDFFAPYRHQINDKTYTAYELYDSLSGVYFADWSDPEAVREECEEYAAYTRPPATIDATVTVTATGALATKEADHAQA